MQKSTTESASWQKPLHGIKINQNQPEIPLKSGVLGRSGGVISKLIWRFMRLYYSCDIAPSIICEGVVFAHSGFGCLLNPKAIIGSGTVVQHSVTIGEVRGKVPVIGKNCYIGARSIIIGDLIVGDNVIIGAGTVVTKSIPDNCTVVGNPMRIIKQVNN